MSEPAACLNEQHIVIPENAAAIMYVKGHRGNYVAVAIPTFESFTEYGARHVASMVDAVERDARVVCRRCDQVFEAHEKDDVSAEEQWRQHRRDMHP